MGEHSKPFDHRKIIGGEWNKDIVKASYGKDPMSLAKVAFLLCLTYGMLFVLKQILLLFRGGPTRG